MNAAKRYGQIVIDVVIVSGLIFAAVWLWMNLCVMPLRSFNDMRLAPTIGLTHGYQLYPGANGPASTWMYGPLPVWLNLPAAAAAGPMGQLLIAGGINMLLNLAAIAAVCWWWPQGTISGRGRLVAAVIAIAAVPWANWQFIQADNYAIALGLLANLAMMRAAGSESRQRLLWTAATLATATMVCKQTSIAVPSAQLLWLGLTVDRTAVWRHLGRLCCCGCGWLLLILLNCTPASFWFTAVLTPSRLPDRERLDELTPLAWTLGVFLVVPLVVQSWLRWERADRPLLLATLSWLVAWVPGLASIWKIGGSSNCLQGFSLWVPVAAVVGIGVAEQRFGRLVTWLTVIIGSGMLQVQGFGELPVRLTRPTMGVYDEAVSLARKLPGQIWFPCHPLVTLQSEGKLYHAEDGLYVRRVCQLPMPPDVLRAGLPPELRAIGTTNSGSSWGIAQEIIGPPAGRHEFSYWTVITARPRR